jgi:hypothetical protein
MCMGVIYIGRALNTILNMGSYDTFHYYVINCDSVVVTIYLYLSLLVSGHRNSKNST